MVDWVRLKLDVIQFDPEPFELYLIRARESDIRFTTLAELGNTPDHRRSLYELHKICAADIPDRGAFQTYDEYLACRIDVSTVAPGGVILAVHDGTWIGMCMKSLHPTKGWALGEMIGVLAPYRTRGLSVAMKLLIEAGGALTT
jgi:hypothetical protein